MFHMTKENHTKFHRLGDRIKIITKLLDSLMFAKYGVNVFITKVNPLQAASEDTVSSSVEISTRGLKEGECRYLEDTMNMIFPSPEPTGRTLKYLGNEEGRFLGLEVWE